MAKIKFELNREGVKELLQSQDMQNVIQEYVDQVSERAGKGFVGNVQIGKTRVVGQIKADGPKAYYKNLKNNILLKALGGGNK